MIPLGHKLIFLNENLKVSWSFMINRSGPPLSSLEISSRAGHEFAFKKNIFL